MKKIDIIGLIVIRLRFISILLQTKRLKGTLFLFETISFFVNSHFYTLGADEIVVHLELIP